MRVEIDFDDAVDEYVKENKRNHFSGPCAEDIANICKKLINVLPSYEDGAKALFYILQDSDTLMAKVKSLICESEKL
jgi:hypothetical protein